MAHSFTSARAMIRVAAISATLLLSACSATATVIPGKGVSPINDPTHVGDLPAADGPSGIKPGAPPATGTVKNTDGSDIDKLELLAINDIVEYWQQTYPGTGFKSTFKPVPNLLSYDSRDPNGIKVCGGNTSGEINAFYCSKSNVMAWDRGVFVPTARKYFGDVAASAGLLGHEYGHAIQTMAKLVKRNTPTVVREQQADCFAGAYLHYVAAGDSKRFQLSTGDGLNHVLAALITSRDPTIGPDDTELLEQGHGTALDRVSAFQIGFGSGPSACGEIDMKNVESRREGIPMELDTEPDKEDQRRGADVPLDNGTFTLLSEILGVLFHPQHQPTLSFDPPSCTDAKPSAPASYCPATNTISLDVPALQQMGKPQDELAQKQLLQGDNTALSVVVSRYMMALQHERGAALDTGSAALRTACLTAVAEKELGKPVQVPSGGQLVLSAGDLDKAVAGLLTNGLAASDVNGTSVPAGFTRIAAFRAGLASDQDGCYQRFS